MLQNFTINRDYKRQSQFNPILTLTIQHIRENMFHADAEKNLDNCWIIFTWVGHKKWKDKCLSTVHTPADHFIFAPSEKSNNWNAMRL